MTMADNQKSNDGSMKSKVYLDKDGIVHVESIGYQTEDEALKVRKNVLELGKKVPGKINILNDLTKMTNATSGSRKVSVESIKLEEVDKVAIFGASTFVRVVASFITKASGMGDKAKHFKTEEEALEWLKEGK